MTEEEVRAVTEKYSLNKRIIHGLPECDEGDDAFGLDPELAAAAFGQAGEYKVDYAGLPQKWKIGDMPKKAASEDKQT